MSNVILNLPDTKRLNTWHISNLYFGTPPSGEVWRPNVNDLVLDYQVGMYYVRSVDSNGIPTLELLSRFSQESQFNLDSTSLITALSNYQPSAALKIFVDDSVSPSVVNVDTHYQCFGTAPSKMVFFRGTDTSDNGEVISEVYNGGGNLVSDQVPLENMNAAGTAKRPAPFKTSANLAIGEVVTAVAYTASGGVYGKQPFLVYKSSAVRPGDAAEKYLQSVSLKGDLISKVNDDLILNVVGTPLSTVLLKGVLHYSDGSVTEMNIDGSKLALLGLENFDTSFVGRPSKVVLRYAVGSNEPYINGGNGVNPTISKVYNLSNVIRDESFALKVFIIPVWDDANSTWVYNWRLLNLDGDLDVDVTSDVTVMQENGNPLSGTDFTTRQDGILSLDMEIISPVVYENYIHTQKVDITIDAPGAASGQTFLIDYLGDGGNVYGQDIWASTNAQGDALKISLSEPNQSVWLDKLYYAIEPLYDNALLSEAPVPTHFVIEYGDEETSKIAITDFGSNINKPAAMNAFANRGTAVIRWILQTAGGDKALGLTPMFIKNDL